MYILFAFGKIAKETAFWIQIQLLGGCELLKISMPDNPAVDFEDFNAIGGCGGGYPLVCLINTYGLYILFAHDVTATRNSGWVSLCKCIELGPG